MEKPTIKLQTKGNLLWITPATSEIRNLVNLAASFELRVQKNGKYTVEKQLLSQYNESNGLIETYGGLRPRIHGYLTKCGYNVEVVRGEDYVLGADLAQLTAQDLDDLDGRTDQVDVIGLICDHDGGFIVEAPTGWGKSHIIGQVCQVLPDAKIAVVVPGKDITSTLYHRIKKRIREVGMVGGGESFMSRITVCTMESVHKLAKNEWDLMIFDEVHRAGAPSIANKLAEVFYKTKCVGLSASPTGRTDGADLMVEALFGPVIYRVNYSEGVSRGAVVPIEARIYRVDLGPQTTSSNGSVINRICLWRNEERNRLIARIANEIPDDEQTLITVATADHALYLRKHLPNFEVVFSNLTSKGTLNSYHKGEFQKVKGLYKGKILDGRREAMRVSFEKGELKKVIATGVWNTGVDFKQLAYLIRADGMASDIASTQTPGRLSRTNEGKELGVLIDFYDAFKPSLESRSKKRVACYRKKGWDVKIIETNPTKVQTMRR